MSVPLSHQRSVFRCIHGSKIKHCYIWLAIVINCKIQGRQLVVGCKVSSFSGVGQQIALVHVFPTEQQLSINGVLRGEKDVGWETPISSLNWNTAVSQHDWEPYSNKKQARLVISSKKPMHKHRYHPKQKVSLLTLNKQLCLQQIIASPSSLIMCYFQDITSLTSNNVINITARLFCTRALHVWNHRRAETLML